MLRRAEDGVVLVSIDVCCRVRRQVFLSISKAQHVIAAALKLASQALLDSLRDLLRNVDEAAAKNSSRPGFVSALPSGPSRHASRSSGLHM